MDMMVFHKHKGQGNVTRQHPQKQYPSFSRSAHENDNYTLGVFSFGTDLAYLNYADVAFLKKQLLEPLILSLTLQESHV